MRDGARAPLIPKEMRPISRKICDLLDASGSFLSDLFSYGEAEETFSGYGEGDADLDYPFPR